MKEVNICNKGVEKLAMDIIRNMTIQDFIPDYVVGITKGGLNPAILISEYFDIKMHTLHVDFGKHADTESNCWMAEDAFGYQVEPKKILIVNDINKTGKTFEWIKNDWQNGCMPFNDDTWNEIWNNTVKFAVLVNDEASNFKNVDFCGSVINTTEDACNVVFPWNNWWK